MKILYAASEVAPFAKTGGLADVAGALPAALARLGHDVRIVMPLYKQIDRARFGLKMLTPEMYVAFPESAQIGCVMTAPFPGSSLPVYFIGHDEYFDRPGLYQEDALDYPDNAERFAYFCKAALWSLVGLGWKPDVICCNDWQTALIPTFLRQGPEYAGRFEFDGIKTLFTIHNLAYQGAFDASYVWKLGLPGHVFSADGLEFYGRMNLMKAGIVYSDKISTVSRRYAEEIQTEEFGCGLEGILQARRADLTGILNGIDPKDWSPDVDGLIPAKYSVGGREGKAKCKAALQKLCGLPAQEDIPLIGVISRLADQKGFDLIAEVADTLMRMKLQFVLLGTGEKKYHELFEALGKKNKKRASIHLRFDNKLAHWIEAGADMFLMPSRYEPCGLNQLYSLRYGTVPIVRRTGGLADSIMDYDAKNKTGTGFVFEDYTGEAMLDAIQRAVKCYRKSPKAWAMLVETGMQQDFTWNASAKAYGQLLQSMIGR
ncbi:MAG: glycogen synthase GlgA [Candidatus Sumerlaeota bacterium]|nr:glycogen synthase GlgA [Candidatus Sumerlaeota bacterium]